MAISKEQATAYRKQLAALDLKKPEDMAKYKAIRREVIEKGEGNRTAVYTDTAGCKTIGIGCNLDANKKEWNEAFGNKGPNYDDVCAGDRELTKREIDTLFNYMIGKREKKLREEIYPNVWDKLKPNERLAIEDLYYNGQDGLVGKKTQFYKHIHAYVETGNAGHLDKALWEVRHNSNRHNDKGIENRRIEETELLNTYGSSDEKIRAATPKSVVPSQSQPSESKPAKAKPKVAGLDIPEDVRELAMQAVDSKLGITRAEDTESPQAALAHIAKAKPRDGGLA